MAVLTTDIEPHVGQRVFFQTKHICCFGNIIKIDEDQRLLIYGDDGLYYEAELLDVVLL